jgi:sugar phosphate isomerase/epimerase
MKAAAAAAAAGALPGIDAPLGAAPARAAARLDLGIASYTFRAFTLDQAIVMTRRLRVSRLALKDVHLPMTASPDEVRSVRARLEAAGLQLSSCGVVYMKTAAEVHRAFAYARLAGIKMMVGVPDPPLLDLAERTVRETDISLAIHNHGPTDEHYPSPESAYRLIKGMDPRMGLCIDVGHTRRLGLDPAKDVERFFDRLLDLHIKDVSAADALGTPVEIGSGVIDTPALLRTLARLGYAGTLHLEYEKDETDPLPGAAESLGYVRGVIAAL